MNKQIIITFLFVSFLGITSIAQIKDCYKKVDRVVWVVKDLNMVVKGWKDLGFTDFISYGMVPLQMENGQVNVYLTSGNLGGVHVSWIQPNSGNNLFTKFLEENGDGAFALMHRTGSKEALEKEVARLKDLKVPVLVKGSVETDSGPVNFVMMDTGEKGKYVLGILHGPDDLSHTKGTNKQGLTFSQYAFAIENPDPVSEYWVKLGFPPMQVTPGTSWGKEYYGQPADFEMNLGWQRHGNIVYEWCIPLRGPTVYHDHIEKYGEGIQHFGFGVKDMDEAIEYFENKGYEISMSGGWGDKGKPGSGRFAYVDTEKIGGETIELLWSYK